MTSKPPDFPPWPCAEGWSAAAAAAAAAPASASSFVSTESLVKSSRTTLNSPVEHVCPALHGDTLEHGQHGEQEVVKVGDAIVGAVPALPALGAIDGTLAPVP